MSTPNYFRYYPKASTFVPPPPPTKTVEQIPRTATIAPRVELPPPPQPMLPPPPPPQPIPDKRNFWFTPMVSKEAVSGAPDWLRPVAEFATELTTPLDLAIALGTAGFGPLIAGGRVGATAGIRGGLRGLAAMEGRSKAANLALRGAANIVEPARFFGVGGARGALPARVMIEGGMVAGGHALYNVGEDVGGIAGGIVGALGGGIAGGAAAGGLAKGMGKAIDKTPGLRTFFKDPFSDPPDPSVKVITPENPTNIEISEDPSLSNDIRTVTDSFITEDGNHIAMADQLDERGIVPKVIPQIPLGEGPTGGKGSPINNLVGEYNWRNMPTALKNTLHKVGRIWNPFKHIKTIEQRYSLMLTTTMAWADEEASRLTRYVGPEKFERLFGEIELDISTGKQGRFKFIKPRQPGYQEQLASPKSPLFTRASISEMKKQGIDPADITLDRILDEVNPLITKTLNQHSYIAKHRLVPKDPYLKRLSEILHGGEEKWGIWKDILNVDQKNWILRRAEAFEHIGQLQRKQGLQTANKGAKVIPYAKDDELWDIIEYTPEELDEIAQASLKSKHITPDDYNAFKTELRSEQGYSARTLWTKNIEGTDGGEADVIIAGLNSEFGFQLNGRISSEGSRKFSRVRIAEDAGFTYAPANLVLNQQLRSKLRRAYTANFDNVKMKKFSGAKYIDDEGNAIDIPSELGPYVTGETRNRRAIKYLFKKYGTVKKYFDPDEIDTRTGQVIKEGRTRFPEEYIEELVERYEAGERVTMPFPLAERNALRNTIREVWGIKTDLEEATKEGWGEYTFSKDEIDKLKSWAELSDNSALDITKHYSDPYGDNIIEAIKKIPTAKSTKEVLERIYKQLPFFGKDVVGQRKPAAGRGTRWGKDVDEDLYFEVHSRAKDPFGRQFSAMTAQFEDGRILEDIYQMDIKELGWDGQQNVLKFTSRYDRQVARQNPKDIFVFGDNEAGFGTGPRSGTAIIRPEPNAMGIPTKRYPRNQPQDFWTDDTLENNKRLIDQAISRILKRAEETNARVIIPWDQQGRRWALGIGHSRLDQNAPMTFRYLQKQLDELSTFKRTAMPAKGTSRLMISGGRNLQDREFIERIIDLHIQKYGTPQVIIHGAASGADSLVDQIAKSKGIDVISEKVTDADWRRIGPSAGPRRNQYMIDEHSPTHFIAFPGGRGTQDALTRAETANLEVWDFKKYLMADESSVNIQDAQLDYDRISDSLPNFQARAQTAGMKGARPRLQKYTSEQVSEEYDNLWRKWFDENPELLEELAKRSEGKALLDPFSPAEGMYQNQARSITKILDERFPLRAETKAAEAQTEAEFAVVLAHARRVMGVDHVNEFPILRPILEGQTKGYDFFTNKKALQRKIQDYIKSVKSINNGELKSFQKELGELEKINKTIDPQDVVAKDNLMNDITHVSAEITKRKQHIQVWEKAGKPKSLDFDAGQDYIKGMSYGVNGWNPVGEGYTTGETTLHSVFQLQKELDNADIDELKWVEEIIDEARQYNANFDINRVEVRNLIASLDNTITDLKGKIDHNNEIIRNAMETKVLEEGLQGVLFESNKDFVSILDDRMKDPVYKTDLIHLRDLQPDEYGDYNLEKSYFGTTREEMEALGIPIHPGEEDIFLTIKDHIKIDNKIVPRPHPHYQQIINTVNTVNKLVDISNIGTIQKYWLRANSMQRMVALGIDASVINIHLLPLWFNHPEVQVENVREFWSTLLKTFKDPKLGAELAENFKSSEEFFSWQRKYPEFLTSESNEIFDIAQRVGWPKAFERIGKPFEVAFGRVLDVAGINLLKALDYLVDESLDEVTKAQRRSVIANYVNEMRGLYHSGMKGISPKQANIESSTLLAGRYRRAIFGIWAKAFTGTSFERYMAQKALINLFTGMAMTTMAIQMLSSAISGDTSEEAGTKIVDMLDPSSGSFLLFSANDQKVGPGSKFTADARILAKAMNFFYKSGTQEDMDDWENFLALSDDNPGIRWVRAQLAYTPSTAWDFFTGTNYIGEPQFREGENSIETIGNFVAPLTEMVTPMWINSTFFENTQGNLNWGDRVTGSGTRFLSEFTGLRSHPQGASAILKEASWDIMNGAYENLEPFEKDILRYSIMEQLSPLQEQTVKRGTSDFALYFSDIERIEREFQNELIEMTKLYPNTPEGNRNMYDRYRQLKSYIRGQKYEVGYDIEFDEPDSNVTDPKKVALNKYFSMFEKVRIPGTQLTNWDQWEVEYEILMNSLTLEQQAVIARNTSRLPIPYQFLERIKYLGEAKEYKRIMKAQELRELYLSVLERPDLVSKSRDLFLMR